MRNQRSNYFLSSSEYSQLPHIMTFPIIPWVHIFLWVSSFQKTTSLLWLFLVEYPSSDEYYHPTNSYSYTSFFNEYYSTSNRLSECITLIHCLSFDASTGQTTWWTVSEIDSIPLRSIHAGKCIYLSWICVI